MRIGELSRSTGVTVPTIKFYLREGLLPPGEATSPTQAQYDESHVRRLRLVRALVEVARLPLTSVRAVTSAVDDPPESLHDLLGIAHDALPPEVADDVDVSAAASVVEDLGWDVHPGSRALRQLAAAMSALDGLGLPASPDVVARYGRAVEPIAAREIEQVPTGSGEEAVTYVVSGTALYEPVIAALRRLAHQDLSARRFGPRP